LVALKEASGLRKRAGTRVEAVSSHAVAKRLLGHADMDVTDSFLMPTSRTYEPQ
jgi:hypothetical protein